MILLSADFDDEENCMAAGNSATPIIFMHVGWSEEYRGRPDDQPQGKFGYIQEGNDDPGEALNFKVFRQKCYGYAPFHNEMNLRKLGAAPAAEFAENVLVVWTATNPDGSGRFVVGWYKNARVYASLVKLRPDRKRPDVLAEAASDGCYVVPLDDRTFFVPCMKRGWPGVSSVFYASEKLDQAQIAHILSYINDGQKSGGFFEGQEPKLAGTPVAPHENDPAQRAKVEKAAVDFVTAHYEHEGWKVRSVEKDNCGWDLEANLGARLLLIEVKGRSGTGSVELSPNEYQAMCKRENAMNYRLAIVFDALGDNPARSIFSYHPATDRWLSESGRAELKLTERIAASASF